MKSAKLVIVLSDLWAADQLAVARLALQRGLSQIHSSVASVDLFAGAEHCSINADAAGNIALDNCDIALVTNATKARVVAAVTEALRHDLAVVLYVGEAALPFGHWLLRDGVFHGGHLAALLQANGERKAGNSCVLVTMAPCDDWQLLEKRQIDSFAMFNYNLLHGDDNADSAAAVAPLVDGLHHLLTVGGLSRQLATSAISATVATSRQPLIYAFLDRGSPSVPALLALDGFAMLLNVGFNRSPDSLHYLQFYQQIDVAMLTHIAYNNLLSLSAFNSIRLNHLLLPPIGVDCGPDTNLATADDHSALHIDLKSWLTSALCKLRNGGTQCSTVSIKAKSGGNAAVKPVPLQLFHKIGYGSLELIPLCPPEDDNEVKRSVDEWKKCKYTNESQQKSVASSVAVLIVWKPFSPKAAIKRVLYIGSKCAVRKYFPTVLAALHSAHDFLRQAEFVPADGLAKKTATTPRKAATPPVAAGAVATSTVAANAGKTAAAASSNAAKGKPATEKPASRPTTASHSTKDDTSKRPHTATGKQQPAGGQPGSARSGTTDASGVGKKGTTTAAGTKSTAGSGAASAPSKRPATGTSGPTKRPESGKPAAQTGHKGKDIKTKTTPASSASATPAIAPAVVAVVANNDTPVHNEDHSGKQLHHNVAQDIVNEEHHEDKHHTVPNGNHHYEQHETKDHDLTHQQHETEEHDLRQHQEHHETEEHDLRHQQQHHETEEYDLRHQQHDAPEAIHAAADSPAKLVATVGTVECAITEHGEADFCDDTPEELSAAQMREMGLYDDDDNDEKGRAAQSGGSDCRDMGNLAHLPMEGSFYGKDSVDVLDNGGAGNDHLEWNQPLAMPAPVKDTNPKKGPKTVSQIYVDCLCVPGDLDRDDLRCVFESVRFRTAFLQLEKPDDLTKSLDVLLEERERDGAGGEAATVVPSVVDESLLVWARDNGARLQASLVTVATDLTRCSITAGGVGAGDSAGSVTGGETCQGMKLEL